MTTFKEWLDSYIAEHSAAHASAQGDEIDSFMVKMAQEAWEAAQHEQRVADAAIAEQCGDRGLDALIALRIREGDTA